ncbi:hypothetical protein GIB67_004808 [Kingdonia uniflora]|uniref:Glycine hydroxymethyltransferase n=1 Tax=Kingdonia uniflora TaxID=39325 RepID=A0A7J7LN83_9MAGN|nr:hypothetical protein GIB67_004808 [Kingdonia uniflora]
MIGHHVTRRFRWDCYGLPIEFEIDKKLGIKTREQVIQMGIDNYNEECMSIVKSTGCKTSLSNFEANSNYKIADAVGAFLMMNMAHISGLVAASVVVNSFEYCDIVTITTDKGGPHNHTFGGLAVCLKHAQSPEFKAYQGQVVSNCRALSSRLIELGYKLVSGRSDNHFVLVDLGPLGLDPALVK